MQRRQWTAGLITVIILLIAGAYLLGVNKPVRTLPPTQKPTIILPSPSKEISPSATISATTTPTARIEIRLTLTGFVPTTLTITKGQTVTWINTSGIEATVNSNPHPTHTDYPPLNLGTFPSGGTLSLTFPTAGTYGFHNHLNPSEKGTIIVK